MASSEDYLIYGRHPILEALKEEKPFEKLLVQKPTTAPELKQIITLANAAGIPVQFVPLQKLNSITRKNHQGVIGYASVLTYYLIEDILEKVYADGRTPLFLILDQITDVRNFGAIARSAECLGADAIVVPAKGSALLSGDAMKASAGALNKVPICKVRFLTDAIDFFNLNGIQVYSSDVKGGKPLSQCDFTVPVAVILGSEEKGVSPSVAAKANARFYIPMIGELDSLNVSVSAGIVLYEVQRQRTIPA
ncbi:MAG: 23S rRNA (guanosine(2251)-2'-O)-methyltransferase RlmB [Chitinophagales bacterium]|nr:23S rRNA (guanosine(2251)-2'-O)-methyltransferase RlmB [Chitinophagales bacterium]